MFGKTWTMCTGRSLAKIGETLCDKKKIGSDIFIVDKFCKKKKHAYDVGGLEIMKHVHM